MYIVICDNFWQEKWDDFVKLNALDGGFLQSWQWGELLKAEKADRAEILQIGVRSERGILAVATIIKNPLGKGGFYWYSPRGPIFKTDLAAKERAGSEDFLYEEIKKITSRAVFLRIEPPVIVKLENIEKFKIKKTLDLQPRQTLILDLVFSEEELLKGFHQKTRYNINLAAKKGLEIKEGSVADFSEFWRLMTMTGARDDFRLHSAEHYRNLLSGSKDFIKLFFASYNGKNIAAGLFCFWGGKVTYLHGASDNEFRSVMAPYLLQWSVIKRAKKESYKYYDFYGISAKKWPGVTRFKLGFGGRIENYPGTYDVIFRPVLYGFYEFIRKLRRLV